MKVGFHSPNVLVVSIQCILARIASFHQRCLHVYKSVSDSQLAHLAALCYQQVISKWYTRWLAPSTRFDTCYGSCCCLALTTSTAVAAASLVLTTFATAAATTAA